MAVAMVLMDLWLVYIKRFVFMHMLEKVNASQTYSQDSSLSGHTLYKPVKADNTKIPVMLWGNGGCSADATGQAPFLQQLASYGVLVIASGTPKGSGSTNSGVMRASIDWITKQAGKGQYANVDASRIVAAGWSCGGVEAYDQIWDSRVMGIGIWSSGLLNNQTAAKDFKKPIFFFMGGSSDIAYANVSPEKNTTNIPTDH